MSLNTMIPRWVTPLKNRTTMQTTRKNADQTNCRAANLLGQWVQWAKAFMAIVLLTALASCASSGSSSEAGRGGFGSSPIQACKSGDQPIRTSANCLTDDAACYQISDGSWCTGERGGVCPSGSTKLPQGQACPAGGRCFSISDELTCAITG